MPFLNLSKSAPHSRQASQRCFSLWGGEGLPELGGDDAGVAGFAVDHGDFEDQFQVLVAPVRGGDAVDLPKVIGGGGELSSAFRGRGAEAGDYRYGTLGQVAVQARNDGVVLGIHG